MQPLDEGDPRRVGEYELLGRLGGGGMGRVYLGRSPAGRRVAVKVVNEALAGDPEFRERFRSELAAARRVHAFYTASVLRADPDAAVPWMATAYIQGPSLQQRVLETGPLPPAEVAELAAGVAEALTEIHQAGIVHRDLKPSNVMLSPDGPRVIDFGVARAAEGRVITATGTFTGSAVFMSPEQAQGEDVGPATDVFSLGALLFWAATGRPAFGTGQLPAVMYRVVHHEPDLAPIADPSLRALIAGCLAKQPADRPGAAQVLARAAQLLSPDAGPAAVAGQVDERTRGPGPSPRPVPFARPGHSDVDDLADTDTVVRVPIKPAEEPGWSRRRRLLTSGAAALAVILVAAGVTVLLRYPHTEATPIAAHATPAVTAPVAVAPGPTPSPAPTLSPTAKPKKKPAVKVRGPLTGALLLADSFSGKNGAGWGSHWALGRNPDSGQGGGATLRSGTGRLSTSDLGAVGAARVSRKADLPDITDVDVRFTFRFDATTCYPLLYVRANDALDTRTGDFLGVGEDGSYVIGRDTNYRSTGPLPTVGDGSTAATFHVVRGATYDAHFAADGHDLYATIWPTGEPEPTHWALHVHDPATARPGAVGFTVGGGTAKKPSNWFVDDVAIRPVIG